MSFLKQLEEKKNALKKVEASRQEKAAPEEMIMKDESDYYRMLKETFFEAYYDQIEEFTFKSVIVPMTLEETQALLVNALVVEKSKNSIERLFLHYHIQPFPFGYEGNILWNIIVIYSERTGHRNLDNQTDIYCEEESRLAFDTKFILGKSYFSSKEKYMNECSDLYESPWSIWTDYNVTRKSIKNTNTRE